jgi:hypothetical protein
MSSNQVLNNNWQIVSEWNEVARYKRWSEKQARELFDAVSNPLNGVLPWIKPRW